MTAPSPPRTWWLSWRVSQHKPKHFWLGAAAFVVFFALPAAFGWVLSRAFAALEDGDPSRVYLLAGALMVIEIGRMVVLHVGALWFMQSWEFMRSLLRGNMLTAQLASGGRDAGRPIESPSEALARFRDDTEDVASFVDSWIDVAGGVVFSIIALSILVTIDATATAVLLVPMVAVAVVTTALGRRRREVHRLDREATVEVAGLLGDVMAAATTIKVNRAERSVLDRVRIATDHRRTTAVRSRIYDQAIQSLGQSTAELGLGLVILVAIGSLRRGEFGVAEISLFLAYGGWLGFLPRMLGLMIGRSQQATVAFGEMRHLVAERDPGNAVVHRRFPFERLDPGPLEVAEPERRPLDRLEVRDLTARLGGGVIGGVTFTVERGSFTVVTGPTGSGKTTLLRVVLGLAWPDELGGEVRWNGEVIEDRAAFFRPPQAAYLAQIPQLVSDSLADNVLLGIGDEDRLTEALRLAAVDRDVAAMPDGTATMIGPRGLRLSGGQRQRVATARALVRQPELLVVDDVSSALDVETELRLWANLAAAGTTVVAVSHRQVALDQADQVLEMDGGRLVASAP